MVAAVRNWTGAEIANTQWEVLSDVATSEPRSKGQEPVLWAQRERVLEIEGRAGVEEGKRVKD